MKLLQILGKATYTIYIVIILLALACGAYFEFYNRQFDNFIEKNIVIANVDRIPVKSVTEYTVVDNEKNTYYFSRADFSIILDTFELRQKWSTIKITYNTRNNEISMISDGSEIEKSNKRRIGISESVDWNKLIALPIVFIAIGLFYLLRKAIIGEWFFRMYTRDTKENR